MLGQLPAKAAGREQRAGPAGSTDARAARHGAKGAGISLLLRFGEFSRTPAASQQGMGVALVRDEGELRRRKPDDHRTRFTSATLDDLR